MERPTLVRSQLVSTKQQELHLIGECIKNIGEGEGGRGREGGRERERDTHTHFMISDN